MSNLLAAVGRGQLADLDERVERRRTVNAFYQMTLGDLPGVSFMPEARYGRSNRWLTCVTIHAHAFGASRHDVGLHLEKAEQGHHHQRRRDAVVRRPRPRRAGVPLKDNTPIAPSDPAGRPR